MHWHRTLEPLRFRLVEWGWLELPNLFFGSHVDLRILIFLELERDLRDHLLLCHNVIEVVLMALGDESFHLP